MRFVPQLFLVVLMIVPGGSMASADVVAACRQDPADEIVCELQADGSTLCQLPGLGDFCPVGSPENQNFDCPANWGLDFVDSSILDRQYRYGATVDGKRNDGAGVHVFVFDLGIDDETFNQEFCVEADGACSGSRVDRAWSFPDAVTSGDSSTNGHGTRVASVVGGNRYGVAKGVILHPFDVTADGGQTLGIKDIIGGLEEIRSLLSTTAESLPAVINISQNLKNGQNSRLFELGCTRSSLTRGDVIDGRCEVERDGVTLVREGETCCDLMSRLVRELIDTFNVPVIASAGNFREDPGDYWPSDVDEVIVVGGVGPDLQYWERDGVPCTDPGGCGTNRGLAVDLWAPAAHIRAATGAGDVTCSESKGVASGTSFAAPLVTGMVARFMQLYPIGVVAADLEREIPPTVEQIRCSLERASVGWNLDTGTAQAGGSPLARFPADFADDCDNEAPVAADLTLEVVPGVPFFVDPLLAASSDADGDPVRLARYGFLNPSLGVLQRTDGAFVYTRPTTNPPASVDFRYRVGDGKAVSDWATVTLIVQDPSINLPPQGGEDSADVLSGGTLRLTYEDLLANDEDPNVDDNQGFSGFWLHSFTQPTHGSVVGDPPDALVYTPAPGYVGPDSFTYTLSDGQELSAPTPVRITVLPDNRPPEPQDHAYAVSAQEVLQIFFADLLGDGVDPDGHGAVVVGFTQATNGAVRWTNPAGFVYTPDPAALGPDAFTYTVRDPYGAEGTATVTVHVMAPPAAHADQVTVAAGETAYISFPSLLANDTGELLSFTELGAATGGTASLGGQAAIRFDPAPGFVGVESFTYTVVDVYGARTSATVEVTVEDRTPPTAGFSVECAGLACTFDASASADDVGVTAHQWSFGDATGGTGETAQHTYGARGTYTVQLTVSDAAGLQATASQDVEVDGLPVAAFVADCTDRVCTFDAGASTDDGSIVTYGWEFGDGTGAAGVTTGHTYAGSGHFVVRLTVTDDAGQSSTAEETLSFDLPPSAHFTASCNLLACSFDATGSTDDLGIADYAWSFGDGTTGSGVAPSHGYATGGSYPVILTVTDSGGGTDDFQVTVAPNRPPVAVNDSAATDRDVAVVVAVLANDGDPDGGTPWIEDWTQPAHGSVTPSGNGLRYEPAAGYTGGDLFTYRLTDGQALSGWATVSVTVRLPNAVPDARGGQMKLPYGYPSNIGYASILGNDYDPDGQSLAITSFDTAGLSGSLVCNDGTKICTYTPPTSYYRSVTSFQYTVSDGAGGSDTATFKLKVGTVQNPPVAADDSLVTDRDQAVDFTIFDLLANDGDADGDVLGISVGSGRFGTTSCTTPSYDCTYTPKPGFVGFDDLDYTASDGSDGQATATARVFVRPTPLAFDAREDQFYLAQNQQLFIAHSTLTSNDFDPQGQPRSVISFDTSGLHGSLDCTTYSGLCVYQPPINFKGETQFHYTAGDGSGETDKAAVRLWVGRTNGAPSATPDALSVARNASLPFTIFDLLANDDDPEGDALHVTVYLSTPQHGSLSCTSPHYNCTYTPTAGYVGSDSFSYRISDGINVATTTVSVSVQ